MMFSRSTKKRVLVLWYSAEKNFGDYCILQTVKTYLKSWDYDVVDFEVGLPSKILAKEARKCDFLWFAGGGIIERWMPDIIQNYEWFHKKSRYIKYGISGLSVGDFDYSTAKEAIAYWVTQASFFFTRDDPSAQILNELSGCQKVIAATDVVYAMSLKRNMMLTKTYFGINFREIPYPDLTGEFQWKEWGSAISDSMQEQIVGIPDQHDVSEKVNFYVDNEYSPQKVLEVLEQCDKVLAMRFHVILVAARMEKIAIPICYCPKVERLADQLGIQELKLGIHEYDKLKDKVAYLEQHRAELTKCMTQRVRNNERQALEMFDQIKIILTEELKNE